MIQIELIELIETFDPQPEAMVRSFHCAVCGKQHLQTGTLARVWVLFQEGYATQASLTCLNDAQPIPTHKGVHDVHKSKPHNESR